MRVGDLGGVGAAIALGLHLAHIKTHQVISIWVRLIRPPHRCHWSYLEPLSLQQRLTNRFLSHSTTFVRGCCAPPDTVACQGDLLMA